MSAFWHATGFSRHHPCPYPVRRRIWDWRDISGAPVGHSERQESQRREFSEQERRPPQVQQAARIRGGPSPACETDHLASSFEVLDYFSFRHHVFVECEYRESSKEWVFFRATRNVVDTSEISILDGFVRTKSGRPFSLLGLRHENPLGLPRVGPGTEIFKEQKGGWKNNPQSIENAIRQTDPPGMQPPRSSPSAIPSDA